MARSPVHADPHPNVGHTVDIIEGEHTGLDFIVEDWQDRVSDYDHWKDGLAARKSDFIMYAMKLGRTPGTPTNDEVLYGTIGGYRCLMHETWLSVNWKA